MDKWLEAHNFLFDMKVGDKYQTSTDEFVECIKRTDKRIHLSNGQIISIEEMNGYKYLTSKSRVFRHKSYDTVHQTLRDIEGYLTYLNHIFY